MAEENRLTTNEKGLILLALERLREHFIYLSSDDADSSEREKLQAAANADTTNHLYTKIHDWATKRPCACPACKTKKKFARNGHD